MNNKRKPKILVFDIETAPNLAYVWGKYEQDVIDFENEWYVLCWCAKWLDEKKIHSSKLNDYKLFKKDKQNDYEVVKALWYLLDEADVVIAHNGDRFDIKKINARFIYHGFNPPTDYKSIDTLKVAKKHFSFNSNKLDEIGKLLDVGQKVKHAGFSTWLGCMNGNKKDWDLMLKYNKQDVKLLEKVYYKLRPWITNHPNMNLLNNTIRNCPNCGSDKLQKNGFRITKTNKYQRYKCINCGTNCQTKYNERENKPEIK